MHLAKRTSTIFLIALYGFGNLNDWWTHLDHSSQNVSLFQISELYTLTIQEGAKFPYSVSRAFLSFISSPLTLHTWYSTGLCVQVNKWLHPSESEFLFSMETTRPLWKSWTLPNHCFRYHFQLHHFCPWCGVSRKGSPRCHSSSYQ